MNIESKKYKVLNGHVARTCRVIELKTGRVQVVGQAPSAHYLANLSESRFDRECETAFTDLLWPSIGRR